MQMKVARLWREGNCWQKAETRNQKPEGRKQGAGGKAKGRRRKVDGEGQKAEGGRRRVEGGGQKAVIPSVARDLGGGRLEKRTFRPLHPPRSLATLGMTKPNAVQPSAFCLLPSAFC